MLSPRQHRRSRRLSREALRATISLALLAAASLPAQVPAGASPAAAPPPPTAAASRPATADGSPPETDLPDLPEPRHIRWLEEVEPLITKEEKEAFLALERDHHRDAFIRKFWQVRDPYPQTGRNELRERWDERLFHVQSEWGSLSDDRSRIYLVHGPPDATLEVRCTTTRTPVIVWQYNGSDVVDFHFILVFARRGGRGEARIWRPGSGSLDRVLEAARSCLNGNRLETLIRGLSGLGAGYDRTLARVLAKPRPRSEEWVSTFKAFTSAVPADAVTLPARVRLEFLGRVQSRTVVSTLLRVRPADAAVEEYAGFRSYNFEVTGEIVKRGELFETFRYKFGVAADQAPEDGIPMVFQRYLRPDRYTMIFKLRDLVANSYFVHEEEIDVPAMEEMAEVPDDRDSETLRIFREAAEAVGSEQTAIRIVPPAGDLLSGFVRIDTLTSGSDVDRVVFQLDERTRVAKNRPPFNVEIDLGPFPRVHRLRALAEDSDGAVVAEDEVLLNAGEHRFGLRLVEPQRGRSFHESLRARAEVDLPDGQMLERVEFYLGEQLVATHYQEPFVQPIRLPRPDAPAYIRAVAYLSDGNATEDVVFVNSPDYVERVDIQLVELYAAALDDQGRLQEGLGKNDFRLVEDGVEQTIDRFDKVENLPFHAVILLDNSASMAGALGQARRAALRFFETAVTSRDRAAIVTFNHFPRLAVKFTSDRTELGGGLQGLTAEGQTALYDSIMFSLYYFTGIKGQRALLLLSDGKDEVSRFGFEETLDYARRAGVTIYSIGLAMDDTRARHRLIDLANETGGRSYFIENIRDIGDIYRLIQQDLRSQYLIAYQSTNTSESDAFRTIELQVRKPGVTVRTLAGYYP